MALIRPIHKQDADAFHRVLDEVARERRYLGALEAPSVDQVRAFVAGNVDAGYAQFIAEAEGSMVGWCDALPGAASAGSAHIARLGMGILSSHRGQGIGRRLVEATIARVRELGMEKIELSVYSSNLRAIALYRNLGFGEEGRRVRGRLVDGRYDDVILMALILKAPEPAADAGGAPGRPPPGRSPPP